MTGCPSLDMADSTSVRSATLESLTAFATRLAYFSCFSCIRIYFDSTVRLTPRFRTETMTFGPI
jgi:hypothetical protein